MIQLFSSNEKFYISSAVLRSKPICGGVSGNVLATEAIFSNYSQSPLTLSLFKGT